MEHSIKIVAYSKEVGKQSLNAEQLSNEMLILGGRAAGICYMPDNYLESDNGYNDADKAIKRAESTAKRGHHSIFDHSCISYLIRTSKMMAIVLNSMGVYATSEKSARYTAMKANTPEEQEKYDKWKSKLHNIILQEMPDIDDVLLRKKLIKALKASNTSNELTKLADVLTLKNGEIVYSSEIEQYRHYIEEKLADIKKYDDLQSFKLAQENARYMLSVFTPTVLQYSMSYRQTALVVDYLDKFWDDNKNNEIKLYAQLAQEAKAMSNEFKALFKSFPLHDIKNQCIRLMPDTHSTGKSAKHNCLCDSYTVSYLASFAALAQLTRHRTIRHSFVLCNKQSEKPKYFVPPIVEHYGLKDEWLNDIESLADFFPQGLQVVCTEQGIIEDFALKCKERCCSRAQLETAQITQDVLCRLGSEVYRGTDNICESNKDLIKDMTYYDENTNSITAKPRCKFNDFKCSDSCTFGASKCFNRLV